MQPQTASRTAAGMRTIHVTRDATLRLIDQTRLPAERVEIELRTPADCARAIKTMQVRGAPLIGVVAAFGLAMAFARDASLESAGQAFDLLRATRPTAVNLTWALTRVLNAAQRGLPAERAAAAWAEAHAIADEDVAQNRLIGEHGMQLLHSLGVRNRPLSVLTHCNAGRLATVAYGTALAPLYLLHERGVPVHVWVDETRPRNQGASLTAWELADAGIAHTLIADNAGGQLMREQRIDAVIVGCDRVARNGDVANKIGTYLKALAALDNMVPFLVACPSPTIDFELATGGEIPIEERDPDEITFISGIDASGTMQRVRIAPSATPALNPAFDVTPARCVTAIITERGACSASAEGLRGLFPEKFQ